MDSGRIKDIQGIKKDISDAYTLQDAAKLRFAGKRILKDPALSDGDSGLYFSAINALIDAEVIENDYNSAIRIAKRMLRRTGRRKQRFEHWNILIKLACFYSELGDMESSKKYFIKALSDVPPQNERLFRIRTLAEAAKSALFSGGEISYAEEKALAAGKLLSTGDPLDVYISTQDILGYVQMYLGRYEDAVATFSDMDSRLKSVSPETWLIIERRIHCKNCLAWCCIDTGRIDAAKSYLKETEEIIRSFPQFSFPMNKLAVLEFSGIIASAEGRFDDARSLFEAVLASPAVSQRDTLSTLTHYAELDVKEGRHSAALQKFVSVLDIAERFNQKVECIEANLGLAELFLSKNSLLNCRIHLHQAVEIMKGINTAMWAGRVSRIRSELGAMSLHARPEMSYEDRCHITREITGNLSARLSLKDILDSLLSYVTALFNPGCAAACRMEQNAVLMMRTSPSNAVPNREFFGMALKHAASSKDHFLSEQKGVYVIAAPVIRLSKLNAMIYMERGRQYGEFLRDEILLLHEIADIAAITIDNAVLHSEKISTLEKLDAANLRLRQIVTDQSKELREARSLLVKGGAVAVSPGIEVLSTTSSPKMQAVYDLVERIAETNLPVLVEGETGTGKEYIAHMIHFRSSRKERPFCILNCAAIPDTLFESELFGHKRGAFTGADKDKKGILAAAHTGTVFLDEIELLSKSAQEKLLRVIEGKPFMPVGGTVPVTADVRFVFASNQSLKALVESGGFREDLFYRLTVVQINLPPLRERKEDIPAFVDFFIAQNTHEFSTRLVSKDAMAALMAYNWPGNLRELANEIKKACILTEHKIDVKNLSTHILARPGAPQEFTARTLTLDDAVRRVEKQSVESALYRNRWNKSLTAKELGISRQQLLRLMKRCGI